MHNVLFVLVLSDGCPLSGRRVNCVPESLPTRSFNVRLATRVKTTRAPNELGENAPSQASKWLRPKCISLRRCHRQTHPNEKSNSSSCWQFRVADGRLQSHDGIIMTRRLGLLHRLSRNCVESDAS